MIHTEAIDDQADEFQVACFLIAAQKWSYVVRLPSPLCPTYRIRPIADGLRCAVSQAVGNGWNGPSSFPLAEIFSRPLGAPKADFRRAGV